MAAGQVAKGERAPEGGAMGALMRDRDWSASALGPRDRWPQSLRTTVSLLMESPVPMVLLWGEAGAMLYNDAYREIAADRHPELFGAEVRKGWGELSDFNDHVMRHVLAGGTLSYRDKELVLARCGEQQRAWFDLDYSPVRDEDGRPAGVLALVRETTGRVLAERHANAELDRLKRLFEQAPTFMAMLRGRDHVFGLANPCYMQLVGDREVIGRPVRDALPELAEQGFLDILDEVFRTGEAVTQHSTRVALQRRPGALPETRFVDFVFQPIHEAAGDISQIFVQGSDVTERVEGEMRQRVLMNELDHRVKNTLATVLAILSRTMRPGIPAEEAAEKARRRIMALARAQDVLTRESWDGADLRSMAEAAFASHSGLAGRIELCGPPVRLSPREALSLSLALHELCANALAHGALSCEAGRVRLHWDLEDDGARPILSLVWRESGGPSVSPPRRRGFGATLIERGLAMELGGDARIDYLPEGVAFEFRAQLEAAEAPGG